MKDFKLKSVGVIASLVLLSACNESAEPGNKTGAIEPCVSYDATMLASGDSDKPLKVTGLEEIKVSDLQLTLVSEDGEVNETFLAGNFPTDQEFATGKYTMTASYGDLEAEGFEVPAISGETQFDVTEDSTTEVELTATPSKAMISINIDRALTEYMTSVTPTLITKAGNEIEFSTGESRSAFVKPGETYLNISFVKPNGMGATMEVARFDAEARRHYHIEVTMGGDGYGEINEIVVVFDERLEQEDVKVDISDEVLSYPAPVITTEGFANGEELSVTEGDVLPSGARFLINARSGIAKAMLTTTGLPLLAQGWPAEIDLTKASATEQALLTRLGFKDLGLFRNPAKMAAIDLGHVVGHIPASTTADDPVAFTLVVTDKKGCNSEPASFSVKIEKMQLALSVTSGYTYNGGKNIMCVVSYNGKKNLKDILTMQYMNDKGEFADRNVTAVSSPSQSGSIDYPVVVGAPSDAANPIVFRAKCGDLLSNTIEIPCSDKPVLTIAEKDVYATSVWATVSSSVLSSQTPVAQISYDNGQTYSNATVSQQSGGTLKYTNLSPSTAYMLRVKMGALISDAVRITTEAAAQIPNSNMEEWDSSQIVEALSGGYKWTNYKPGAPWATINDASLSGAAWSGMCTANETTMWTVDAHGGEKAAEVRSAACSPYTLTSASDWSYYRGELYVGAYNNGANYGISFASRPSALKFWYKYLPYNNTADQGYAMIQILDSAGNVIASGETRLNPTNAYQEVSIELSYKRSAAKASQIIVLFRSSATTDFLNASGFPSIGGSLTKKLTGSKLYVDDIELSY